MEVDAFGWAPVVSSAVAVTGLVVGAWELRRAAFQLKSRNLELARERVARLSGVNVGIVDDLVEFRNPTDESLRNVHWDVAMRQRGRDQMNDRHIGGTCAFAGPRSQVRTSHQVDSGEEVTAWSLYFDDAEGKRWVVSDRAGARHESVPLARV